MILGTILLIGALFALLLCAGSAFLDILRRGDRKIRDLSIGAAWGAFGMLGTALLLLAGSFLNADTSLQYVWENVKTHYDSFERLSGLWVGRAGSLLLWSFFIIAFWCLEEVRHRRALAKSDTEAAAGALSAHHAPRVKEADADQMLADAETVRRYARLAVSLVALLFVVIVLYGRPFAPVDPLALEQSPDGRGINPQLLIFYNAIHPPIVFLAYAATLLPSAFAIGHFISGRPGWLGPARRWAHLAFVFLTIGVTLGALWAYIALGWGGYWDWDPVEISSLVPWVLVVAFLHAAYRNDGKGMFPVAAPFIGTLVFAGALFATLVVRSGVWVSLHSFIAEGDAQDAWQRYLSALDHPEVLMFSVLIGAFIALTLVFASVQATRIDTGAIETPKRPAKRRQGSPLDRLLSHIDLHNLFIAGVLLLLLLATVTITLLFVGINGFPSSRIREEVFTSRTGPVALTAVTVMAVAISIGYLPRRTVLAMLGGVLLVGAVAALFLGDVWSLALAVPVLGFAGAVAGFRVFHAWRRMPKHRALRFAGIHLVHLGVAVLLLGHGLVSTFDNTEDTVELRVGETRSAGPYEITLLGIDSESGPTSNRVHHVTARLLVTDKNGDTRNAQSGLQYYEFQSHYKPEVGVMRTLGYDIYLAPKGIHDPDQGWIFGNLPLPEQGKREARSVDAVTLEVSTLPYINLVWGGSLLMVLGGTALGIASWTPISLSSARASSTDRDKRKSSTPRPSPRPIEGQAQATGEGARPPPKPP